MLPFTRLQVRIPNDLHSWLVEFAEGNDRSLNGQIVAMIREAKQEQDLLKMAPPENCLAAVNGGAEPIKEHGNDEQSKL